MIYLLTLCGLFISAILLFNRETQSETVPKNAQFHKLQRQYLAVYLLATFGDWLQGPYVYKLYSDYGFSEEDIALLYVAGFASSTAFGWLVGHLSDRYGHRTLCVAYGLVYAGCCLTKLRPEWWALLAGRLLGGVATSILFSAFDAWYAEEHLGRPDLPADWSGDTFGKAGCYTGLTAIAAGVAAHLAVDSLGLGSVAPFVLAVPVLLACSALAAATWRAHPRPPPGASRTPLASPLRLILCGDPRLLALGLVQSLFESVLYVFVFSWTPVLSALEPPLGLVFACFMLAFVIGSRLYVLTLSPRLRPTLLLLVAALLAFLSFGSVSVLVAFLAVAAPSPVYTVLLTRICFLCFVLYELSVGLYVPAVSYLKCRVVPEEHRASVANWFRMPMNLFTCLSLTFNRSSDSYADAAHPFSNRNLKKFLAVYLLCSVFLFVTVILCYALQRKYVRRFSRDESSEIDEIQKENRELRDNPNFS